MTKNPIFYFFTILFFLLPTVSTNADTTDLVWSAYLLDSANNQLLRAESNGNFTTVDLLLNRDEATSRGMMAISPDGSIAAYCGYLNYQNGTSDYRLYVQDLNTGALLFSTPYPDNICSVTGFNEGGTHYLVSSAPQYGIVPNDGVTWRMEVFDVATNRVAHGLKSSDGILDFTFMGEDVGFTADARHFDDDSISFVAIPNVGMGLGAQLPAYTWTFGDSTVIENANFGYINGDYDSHSGFAYPALDESLAYVQPGGPVPASNIINVTGNDTIETVYSNTDWVVLNTTWVDDGNTLAIMLLEGANTEDSSDVRYDFYDTETGIVYSFEERYDTYTQVANIPNGALIIWAEVLPDNDTLTPITYFATVNDGVMVYNGQNYATTLSERGYAFLEIVWTAQ